MKQAILVSLALSSADAFAPSQTQPCRPSTSMQMAAGRREALSKIFGGAALIASQAQPLVANALDMDAFINNELSNDTKNCDPKRDPKCAPQLSNDEALCKYGQGSAKSAACKKIKRGWKGNT